jgi:DNA-directed RNA polymerase I subunit RPA1
MRDAVRNGPNVWPGALCIEESNGKKIFLNPNDDKARAAIAKTLLTPFEACSQSTVYDKHGKIRTLFQPKIVHRHLKTGDVMLLNRQPTLHKPSMMAHKARVCFYSSGVLNYFILVLTLNFSLGVDGRENFKTALC